MAINTIGVSLKYGAETPTTELVIKDFPSLLGKKSALETTTLKDEAKTFIPGVRDQAESFEFLANYDASVYAEIEALGDEIQKCSLTFSDGSGYTWNGYISASVNEGGVDAVLEMTISIVPATVPVWANKA